MKFHDHLQKPQENFTVQTKTDIKVMSNQKLSLMSYPDEDEKLVNTTTEVLKEQIWWSSKTLRKLYGSDINRHWSHFLPKIEPYSLSWLRQKTDQYYFRGTEWINIKFRGPGENFTVHILKSKTSISDFEPWGKADQYYFRGTFYKIMSLFYITLF